MFLMRGRRYVVLALAVATVVILFFIIDSPPRDAAQGYIDRYYGELDDDEPPVPVYLPEPDWKPPPIKDPFPLLATDKPPPIPAWNKPKSNLHKTYGLDYAPPLFIGFTRSWPLLLQTVVSYVTAGWPADQIFVVENTGVQRANMDGRLDLQNPYYMNYTYLEKLGVKTLRTPVLMNFAQLQNYYLHLSYDMNLPYFFWSHQDVLAFSFEGGEKDITPNASEEGYQTLYELTLSELNKTRYTDERWADKFFAGDHLTLVNREAYEEVGGWDTFIPYYMTECDMHSRLVMEGWTQSEVRAGVIIDVATTFEDLRVLFREDIEPKWTDPNPPPPSEEELAKIRKEKAELEKQEYNQQKEQEAKWRSQEKSEDVDKAQAEGDKQETEEKKKAEEDAKKKAEEEKKKKEEEDKKKKEEDEKKKEEDKKDKRDEESHESFFSKRFEFDFTFSHKPVLATEAEVVYWRKLKEQADKMLKYKQGERGRNTWQLGQQGGQGDAYYYPARGIAEGIDILTEAGKEVYRRKWGHRDCDLMTGGGLQPEDQWRVAPDWRD